MKLKKEKILISQEIILEYENDTQRKESLARVLKSTNFGRIGGCGTNGLYTISKGKIKLLFTSKTK